MCVCVCVCVCVHLTRPKFSINLWTLLHLATLGLTNALVETSDTLPFERFHEAVGQPLVHWVHDGLGLQPNLQSTWDQQRCFADVLKQKYTQLITCSSQTCDLECVEWMPDQTDGHSSHGPRENIFCCPCEHARFRCHCREASRNSVLLPSLFSDS